MVKKLKDLNWMGIVMTPFVAHYILMLIYKIMGRLSILPTNLRLYPIMALVVMVILGIVGTRISKKRRILHGILTMVLWFIIGIIPALL